VPKLKGTITWEYEASPEYYPEGSTPLEMAIIDAQNWRGDLFALWSTFDDQEFELRVVPA
jgi:hypothetical protein